MRIWILLSIFCFLGIHEAHAEVINNLQSQSICEKALSWFYRKSARDDRSRSTKFLIERINKVESEIEDGLKFKPRVEKDQTLSGAMSHITLLNENGRIIGSGSFFNNTVSNQLYVGKIRIPKENRGSKLSIYILAEMLRARPNTTTIVSTMTEVNFRDYEKAMITSTSPSEALTHTHAYSARARLGFSILKSANAMPGNSPELVVDLEISD